MRHALIGSMVLFVLSLSNSRAENWPQFRGPDGQGHTSAVGLPTKWSDTENVAWKEDVPGEGWSSPVVWENRIYLTTAIASEAAENAYSLHVLCLDGEAVYVLLDKELFKQTAKDTQRIHTKNSHASPTPITDGKRLYVHFGAQGTASLTM